MASTAKRGVRVAVEGCGHGTLDEIYDAINKGCLRNGWDKVDVVIICGDFQAIRNAADLHCIAVPAQHRKMAEFTEYYSGKRTAPYLTVFVGGNHEASNYMRELYYGGWVAPNIYYMGAANVLRLGPLRIAGLSGIYKGYNYHKPHFERIPFDESTVRSVYSVREIDTRKLLQIRNPVDVGISHDWPLGVVWLGDYTRLFKYKKHLKQDAQQNRLGSRAAQHVLERIRPLHWFSAHLHVKYTAIIDHAKAQQLAGRAPDGGAVPEHDKPSTEGGKVHNPDEIDLDEDDDTRVDMKMEAEQSVVAGEKMNEDEIDLDMDETLESPNPDAPKPAPKVVSDEVLAQLPASFSKPGIGRANAGFAPEPPSNISNNITEFLALDKCLPNREFLELLEINPISSDAENETETTATNLQLSYDPEWLAITRVFANDMVADDESARVPRNQGRAHYLPLIEAEEKWVDENITKKGKLTVPENFVHTAPPQNNQPFPVNVLREYNNPQTAEYCALLEIMNPFSITEEEMAERENIQPSPGTGGRGGRGGSRQGGRGRGWGYPNMILFPGYSRYSRRYRRSQRRD